MQINDDVFLVGSGRSGAWMTDAYDCHVYVLRLEGGLVLIDSGAGLGCEAILSNIAKHGFEAKGIGHILITHAHADHSGGARGLKEATGAVVVMSEREAEAFESVDEDKLGLRRARSQGYYPDDYVLQSCKVDVRLGGRETIEAGGGKITAINVPGHSLGSTCYVVDGREGRYVFSGDVVFLKGEIGLLNCYGSSLEDYRNNIGKLGGLNADGLFPGHGMFCLANGQAHLDRAIEAFESLVAPRNAIS